MSDFKYKPLTPGEAATANTMNTAFDGTQEAVNELESYTVRPGGLGPEHVPSIINRVDSIRLQHLTGSHNQTYDLVVKSGDTPYYKGRWPLYGRRNDGTGVEYKWDDADEGVHLSGGSTCLMDNTAATHFVWYQIGYSPEVGGSGKNLLNLEFDKAIALSSASTQAALVMLNVDFDKLIIKMSNDAPLTSEQAGWQKHRLQNYVIFGIQVKLSGSGGLVPLWYTLPTSIRVLGTWADWFKGTASTGGHAHPIDGKSANWDSATVGGVYANSENRDVSIRTLVNHATLTNSVANGGLDGAGSRSELWGVRAVVSMFPEKEPDVTTFPYLEATSVVFPSSGAFTDSSANDATYQPVWQLWLRSGQLSVLSLHTGTASDVE